MATWGFGVAKAAGVTTPDAIVAELCAFASKAAGEKFVPHVAGSYRELADGLVTGAIGIAWLPPIVTVEAMERGAAAVLALPARKGLASYHTAFITRRGGPRTLVECSGRSVAWVDRESASGYVIPRLHLASLGLEPTKLFARETFVGTHPAVVDAVLASRVDVGVTFVNFEPGGKGIQNAGWTDADGKIERPVQLIETAGPIPNDAIVATTKLPVTVRSTLTRWLLQIEPTERDLFHRLVRATEFRVIPDAHFDPLRHMIRTARVRGYSMPPPA